MFLRCNFSRGILLILVHCVHNFETEELPNPSLPLEGRIRHYGYPIETYQFVTEDGYMPTLYRVPHKIGERLEGSDNNKSVVLLLHGMGGSPKNFFLLGNDSMGFGLVNQGFDVWVLCSRGLECGYPRKHQTLNWNKDQNFWKFSLDELGYYDLPAAIDFVIKKTHQEKIFLIGHSAGSTMQFILFSQRPEYNKKVKMAVSYAGTIYLSQSRYQLLHFFSSLIHVAKGLWFGVLNLYEFFPKDITDMVVGFMQTAVHYPQFAKIIKASTSVVGTHRSVLIDYNKYLPLIVADINMRLSAMQVYHYADLTNSGKFIKYDHGGKNKKFYGQSTPPVYNLSLVTCPIAFFYGGYDEVASIANSRRAMSEMPNIVVDYLVPYKKFNHIDFIFANNASQLVYEPTYKLLKDYDNGIVPERRKRQYRRRSFDRKRFLRI